MSGAFLTKVFRRRTQYLIAFIGMTIVFACWTGASADYANTKNKDAGAAVVAMIFVYYWAYTLMHSLTYICSSSERRPIESGRLLTSFVTSRYHRSFSIRDPCQGRGRHSDVYARCISIQYIRQSHRS